jgi:hypothetical protein
MRKAIIPRKMAIQRTPSKFLVGIVGVFGYAAAAITDPTASKVAVRACRNGILDLVCG